MVALGGVVVDHVDHHLDAGIVQAADHGLPLGQVAGGQIARLGREEADRVVAPVVGQLALDQMPVLDEGVHRQELDRGDAQVLRWSITSGSENPAQVPRRWSARSGAAW